MAARKGGRRGTRGRSGLTRFEAKSLILHAGGGGGQADVRRLPGLQARGYLDDGYRITRRGRAEIARWREADQTLDDLARGSAEDAARFPRRGSRKVHALGRAPTDRASSGVRQAGKTRRRKPPRRAAGSARILSSKVWIFPDGRSFYTATGAARHRARTGERPRVEARR